MFSSLKKKHEYVCDTFIVFVTKDIKKIENDYKAYNCSFIFIQILCTSDINFIINSRKFSIGSKSILPINENISKLLRVTGIKIFIHPILIF